MLSSYPYPATRVAPLALTATDCAHSYLTKYDWRLTAPPLKVGSIAPALVAGSAAFAAGTDRLASAAARISFRAVAAAGMTGLLRARCSMSDLLEFIGVKQGGNR